MSAKTAATLASSWTNRKAIRLLTPLRKAIRLLTPLLPAC